MPEIKVPPIYRVVLYRRFDVDDAKHHERYFLEERKTVGIFRKRQKWVPVKVYRFDFGGGGIDRANGDAAWADRIMKEFHINGVTVL